jgi:hypothetical protein
MKLNTLDKLRDCLRDLTPRVDLSGTSCAARWRDRAQLAVK